MILFLQQPKLRSKNQMELKMIIKKICSSFLILLLLLTTLTNITAACTSQIPSDSIQTDKGYFAIEINGVVCGYIEISEAPIMENGKNLTKQDMNIFIMMSLLGSEFNTEMKAISLLDPETRRTYYSKLDIKQGAIERTIELNVEDNVAKITSSLSSQPKTIELTSDILVGNDEVFTNLKKDFLENGKNEVSYNILEAMEEQIQSSTFKKIKEEKVELIGKTFNGIVVEDKNNKTGLIINYWISPEYNDFLKFEVMNRKIYLTDHTVVDKIKVANMNESIFTKANVQIADIQAITYMKLKVEIQPSGISLKPEDLNAPGQKFTGTVIDNKIDGIFEIETARYDGENSPSFPTNFGNDETLAKYLKPERGIECDDPILIDKAEEITKGSKDSWEAATKLSKWVAENIHYAIPGGGTARKTYDIRAGECGAHSLLLAAFCRAVGIPARVVWGAMYAPNYGGGFGQHGWNEIYMGKNGWIQVDATAFEPDYVDAGHIRIAELQSVTTAFNGKKIEVLDHKLAKKETALGDKSREEYSIYFGKYTNLKSRKTFEVLEKDGTLSVNIPGQALLPFNEADNEGRWYCKLSPKLYVEFSKDDNGDPNQMVFHEIVIMTKQSSPESFDENTPESMKPYLGKYLFAAVSREFNVFYEDETLSIDNPLENKVIKLQPPNEKGGWLDQRNKNTAYFDKDDKGNVTALRIDAANKFERGELASNIVENVIKTDGIEKGLEKYRQLKGSESKDVIINEAGFNALGYKLLNEQKFSDAIEIFKLNVEAYPESSNVYDSLGEAYMKSGEKELAIENYQKSLELNPENENAKKMLEELKTQQ
jgi:transglutaminase-like putative cysteine protease/tetratricopeptide (TPR) repeat protein